MSRRFFTDCPIDGARAALDGAEANHLLKVLRAGVGDEVVLFDGTGAEFAASVQRVGRSSVDLQILQRRDINRELPMDLVLGVALPKGDRQRWLVEKAVELGVTCLVPLETTRGVAQPVERARQRLGRAVIEASKQCGRNRLMQIATPQRVDQFFASSTADAMCLIAHPDAAAEPIGALLRASVVRPFRIAVGPEGGFTEEEIAAAGSDCRLVSLGRRILRIETAALALAAVAASHISGEERGSWC